MNDQKSENDFRNKNKILEKSKNFFKKLFTHPDELEKSFLEWFDSNRKLAFLSAVLVGIITHITFITEMIMSPDGLWNSLCFSVPSDWELSLGRWGLFIADKIVNNLAIPNVTAVVGILFIAISAVLIVDLLNLKNKFTIFLVSAAMVVSPAFTGTLMYTYTSVAYCLAMLLSVITVRLIFSSKNRILNFIFAIVVFTFSLGIYQSYIGVTVGLTAIKLIGDLFEKEIKIRWFFVHGIAMCLIVIIGGLLYSNITEIILDKMNVQMADYKGLENISVSNTLKSLKTSIPNTYRDLRDFYFTDEIINNENYSRQEFYKIMFISVIILELILIIISETWKNPLKVICIILMNLILPIAINCILLLTLDAKTYILTAAQMILVIPFASMIYEKSGNKFTFIFKWTALLSMFLIVFTYYLADNASYIAVKLNYNQTYATAIKIMDRIEQTEGYNKEYPIMIAGIVCDNDIRYYKTTNIFDYTLGDIFKQPVLHGTYSGMEGTWTKFLGNYLGERVQFCNINSYKDVLGSSEFKEMGIFPDPDSVKMIYNVMVVKLSENPPMP